MHEDHSRTPSRCGVYSAIYCLCYRRARFQTTSQPVLVMGPAPQSSLPSKPKFSWGAQSPPWTNEKGDQEEHRDALLLWQMFHNALPALNSSKINAAFQAACLTSQLYGRAKDLCSGISDEELTNERAIDLLVESVYRRAALTAVSEAYPFFNILQNACGVNCENINHFGSRFFAQVARFNSISTTTKLPESITALMLLSGSASDDSQRISVLAAAASSNDHLNSQSTNDHCSTTITYQSVSSIIKQCDKLSSADENINARNASSVRAT